MLKIIRCIGEADLQQLFDIYEQSYADDFTDRYGAVPSGAMLTAQQDFYDYLRSFLYEDGNFCAVWVVDGRYCCALRLERYRDGFLLTGLETAAYLRQKGYASKLMRSAIEYCESNALLPIYSHIANSNIASIKTHMNNGFKVISDCAVFLDGSVNHRSKTYCYRNDKKTRS